MKTYGIARSFVALCMGRVSSKPSLSENNDHEWAVNGDDKNEYANQIGPQRKKSIVCWISDQVKNIFDRSKKNTSRHQQQWEVRIADEDGMPFRKAHVL
eukprot:scaffold2290_cov170-Amphora_coffeaeformis.AAC.13